MVHAEQHLGTALLQAAAMYAGHGRALGVDLENYLRGGYVFCTPDRLLLAREIDLDRGLDHWCRAGTGNAWYVRLACGRDCLAWFLAQAPYERPNIAWHREFNRPGGLRIYSTETLKRRIPWAQPE